MRPRPIYYPRPGGYKPDETRPLRNEPVRRDEVRIYLRTVGGGFPKRMTMPLGTYRFEDTGKNQKSFVGVTGLWQPLLAELKIEHDEMSAYFRSVGVGGNQPFQPPSLEISNWNAREYVCEVCGTRFLDHLLAGNMVRLCSDKCERERINRQRRQWRKMNPPDYQAHNAKRDQQRAEARAGRKCAHCGTSIEAARSTRRFCSDICRAKAHRGARKAE